MRGGIWTIGALAAVGAAGIGAWWTLTPAQVTLRADDPAVVAQGRAVYAAHCASCHGAQLEGQANWQTRNAEGKLPAPPHDATGHTWHHPDQVLFDITKHGIARYAPPGYATDMPAYDGILSDADIAAVLGYIKSTWPPNIRAAQERLVRQTGG